LISLDADALNVGRQAYWDQRLNSAVQGDQTHDEGSSPARCCKVSRSHWLDSVPDGYICAAVQAEYPMLPVLVFVLLHVMHRPKMNCLPR
jgi:hypothetical protein